MKETIPENVTYIFLLVEEECRASLAHQMELDA